MGRLLSGRSDDWKGKGPSGHLAKEGTAGIAEGKSRLPHLLSVPSVIETYEHSGGSQDEGHNRKKTASNAMSISHGMCPGIINECLSI